MNDGATDKDQITQRLDLLMSTTAKKDLKHNKIIELATDIKYLISHFDNKGLKFIFPGQSRREKDTGRVSPDKPNIPVFMLHGGSQTKQILYIN